MNPLGRRAMAAPWADFLAEVALKPSLLVGGLPLTDRLLGEGRASWRNLLWHAGLAGLMLIPLASAWGPALTVPVHGQEVSLPLAPATAPVQPEALNPGPSEQTYTPPPATCAAGSPDLAPAVAPPETWAWNGSSLLVLLYAAGACFFLGRLGLGLLYVASLRRQTQAERDERFWPLLQEPRTRLGIRRPVVLGTSERLGSPLQVGVFSPMAILPAGLLGRLDEHGFRAMAAHELARVRRWDYLVHLLALVVLAAHWFNPLAWLALHRLRETGEHACDEWAVRLIGRNEVYTRALLDVLGEVRGRRTGWGLGMAFQAERRVERILAMKNAIPAGVGRWAGGVMALGLSAGG